MFQAPYSIAAQAAQLAIGPATRTITPTAIIAPPLYEVLSFNRSNIYFSSLLIRSSNSSIFAAIFGLSFRHASAGSEPQAATSVDPTAHLPVRSAP